MEQTDLNIMKTNYNGRKSPLLKLGILTGFLTLLTLGIYRFWARTRVRKYLWSAIAPGGHSLEYNGTGTEKFLGFLIAVAVLAVYLGVFQLILAFFGYSLISLPENDAQALVQQLLFSLVALVSLPIIYYAQYRARRYILSRTRWRGIRFGAEPAAWGYVQLALINFFITVISLGILLPRQTFNLEKFRADRTWYGNAQLHQGGDWKILLPAMRQTYIGMAIIAVGLILTTIGGAQAFMSNSGGGEDFDVTGIGLIGIGAMLLSAGYSWLMVGLAIYRVASWRTLANYKTLGENVRFKSNVDTSDVVLAYIFGGMLAGFLALLLAGILAFLFGLLTAIAVPYDFSMGSLDKETITGVVAIGFGYVAFFVMFTAISLVSITQPILRAYASTLVIENPEELDDIVQRSGDDFVEAEGFADALDVGAAI